MIKLSIITINYNNAEGLERTIKSIECQTCEEFEYIVVDGASSDKSLNIIHKYENCISKWISEPDTGIYCAMNKGVRMSTGQYCLFMNSGDELYAATTIEDIFKLQFDEDYVQGIIHILDGRGTFSPPPKDVTLAFYFYGNNNSHQASLIKRTMLMQHPYDEKLRIASDLKFNVECLIKYNCSYKAINVVIAHYETGGRSSTIEHSEEIKSIYRDIFPERVIKDYAKMDYCFKFPIKYLMPCLSWIGNLKILKRFRKEYRKKQILNVRQ